jgi:hypothetical protein
MLLNRTFLLSDKLCPCNTLHCGEVNHLYNNGRIETIDRRKPANDKNLPVYEGRVYN